MPVCLFAPPRNYGSRPAFATVGTWHEVLDAIFETETCKLDKKQHALTMIDRMKSAMRM
jgi:hypothetical protein